MSLYLRQVCLVAEKLETCRQDIEVVCQTPVCHRDPEVATFGLENALFAFGTQFLEVVAPIQEGTAAGRFLQRRGGDGGYMVICQVPTLEEQAALRQRASDQQVRVAYEADRGTWNILQLHPRDMGAAFLEVDWDEQADSRGNWQPAGGLSWTQHARATGIQGITGVTLSSSNSQWLAEHWSTVIGVPVTDLNDGPAIQLANATLRFTQDSPSETQGLTGIDISVKDPALLLARAKQAGLATDASGFRLGGVTFSLQAAADH